MRKTFRLGGEFEREALPRDSVDDARHRFMKACVKVEPNVLKSLLNDETWAEMLTGADAPEPVKADQALRNWGKKWNLSDPWCLDWAQNQVRLRWAKERGMLPKNRKEALAMAIATGNAKLVAGPPLQLEPLMFPPQVWEFERETRRRFETRVIGEFRRALTAYCDAMEKRAESEGLLRTPERRNEDHFFWLARNRIKGQKFVDIALLSEGLRPKQVQVAAKRLADFIGLTRRKISRRSPG
jgi:hypothetical protein